MDRLFHCFQQLRTLIPPTTEASGDDLGGNAPVRERVARTLRDMGDVLSAGDIEPLHPVQCEALFRQLSHVLSRVGVWPASGAM